MQVVNICKLGNSGRNTDDQAAERTRPRYISRSVRISHQNAQRKIRNGCHYLREETSGGRCQHESKIDLPLGKCEGNSKNRTLPYDRKSIGVKWTAHAASQRVINKLCENIIDTVCENRILAPVASNAIGISQDISKTSHARSLMQPRYSTCEVFLRTLGA